MCDSVRSLTWAVTIAGVVLFTRSQGRADEFEACGTLECDGGCLIFRTGEGVGYELIVPDENPPGVTYHPRYTSDHKACITGTVSGSPYCPGAEDVVGRIVESDRTPWHATITGFSTAEDFARGQFINLHTGTDNGDGQLQINNWSQTTLANPPVLPTIWVACSQRGTVMRIATEAHYSPVDQRCVDEGEILGEYYSSPTSITEDPFDPGEILGVCGDFPCQCQYLGNRKGGDPSRTTVDHDGNVWVANRSDAIYDSQDSAWRAGHVVKIGSGLGYQWIDRNNNGILDTSTGVGDIRPWFNNNEFCENSDVDQALDELILNKSNKSGQLLLSCS